MYQINPMSISFYYWLLCRHPLRSENFLIIHESSKASLLEALASKLGTSTEPRKAIYSAKSTQAVQSVRAVESGSKARIKIANSSGSEVGTQTAELRTGTTGKLLVSTELRKRRIEELLISPQLRRIEKLLLVAKRSQSSSCSLLSKIRGSEV